ncbi:MAG: hypothetical protein DWH78_00730, partial [Planctomycetota bacterium]
MWLRPCDHYQLSCTLPRDMWLGGVALLLFCFVSEPAVAQQASSALFGITLRNDFLESRFTRTRTEEQPVSKLLMESNVTGSQSTVTETRLRIVPDA